MICVLTFLCALGVLCGELVLVVALTRYGSQTGVWNFEDPGFVYILGQVRNHVDVSIVVHSAGGLLALGAAGIGFVSPGMALAFAVPNRRGRGGWSPGLAEGDSLSAGTRAAWPSRSKPAMITCPMPATSGPRCLSASRRHHH